MDPFAMQANVRQNTAELQSYLQELSSWEGSIKNQDAALKAGKVTLTKKPSAPIRTAASSISLPDTSASDRALFEEKKKQGNEQFQAGNYVAAVESYSECIILCPKDPVAYANRAQAYLKLKRWQDAEADCTAALQLDRTHVKSLFRRATARKEMMQLDAAMSDVDRILRIERTNKAAKALRDEISDIQTVQKQKLAKQQQQQQEKQSAATPSTSSTTAEPPRRRLQIVESDDEEDETPTTTPAPAKPAPASTAAPTSATAPAPAPATATATTAPKATAPASAAPTSSPARSKITVMDDDEDVDVKAISSAPSTTTTAAASTATKATPASTTPSPSTSTSTSTSTTTPVKKEAAVSSTTSSPSVISPANSPSSASSQFRVPRTALEVENQFRSLSSDPITLARYLRILPIASYPTLFRSLMSGSLLTTVASACHAALVKSPESGALTPTVTANILAAVSRLPRFDLSVQFLSSTEQSQFADIIRTIQADATVDRALVQQITDKYRVSG